MIHVKQQISKATGTVYTIKNYVPTKILRNIYFALIQPYLIYCIPIWGCNHTNKEFQDIEGAMELYNKIIVDFYTVRGDKSNVRHDCGKRNLKISIGKLKL